MLRLFIGILLPEPTRTLLLKTQRALQVQPLAVRWIKPENLHITLHFLGDVGPEHVPMLQTELDKRLAGCHAPHLTMHELGAFPTMNRPNVVWAGIKEGVEPLRTLYDRAIEAGKLVGVKPEQRTYHPHITLGYVRKDATPVQKQAIAHALRSVPAPHDQTRTYSQIALIQSVLTPTGSKYAPLATWNLADE